MENVTPAPAKRALAALDQASATAPAPTKRISKKIIAAIDAMVSGECKKISEAAEKVGLARESLSRALNKPHRRAHAPKGPAVARFAASRAGATKVELLDSPSELVRDRASSFVLGLAGIQPAASPSVNLNIEVKAGYVIDLSDDPPPMRTIPHVGYSTREATEQRGLALGGGRGGKDPAQGERRQADEMIETDDFWLWHETVMPVPSPQVRYEGMNGPSSVAVRGPSLTSGPEDFHLRALPEPYVNLSIHTAPIVRPFPWHSDQWARSLGFARRSRSNQSLAPLV
jgi:hypothetical protein